MTIYRISWIGFTLDLVLSYTDTWCFLAHAVLEGMKMNKSSDFKQKMGHHYSDSAPEKEEG